MNTYKELFEYIRDPQSQDLALVACFVNDEATVAISRVVPNKDGTYEVSPLYVGLTPSMQLKDPNGKMAVNPEEENPE